ncbi:hypothetical protein ACIO3O_00145 [Streptomyces sp. NPDC087440]|uniref:hypothetical protein n=1 Tax=Streptomyces sp. NPDC087440 TaxID=3365790 RepID=UPI00381EC749
MTQPGNEPWIRPPWIGAQDSEHYKEIYRDISHSVNLVKLHVAALSSSLTAFKTERAGQGGSVQGSERRLVVGHALMLRAVP